MLDANVPLVARLIEDDARVLDVGGWLMPFRRADCVVDLMPYDSRGSGQGDTSERFTRDTWYQMDVCASPLPFGDKEFDFVVCSHTLEDIRDPLSLCSELNRVAKAGYLETPSTRAELAFGIESKTYAGWYHHRWLVEMRDGHVAFRHKPATVHGNWKYHLPKREARVLTQEQRVTWMTWKESFTYEEVLEFDKEAVEAGLEAFVLNSHSRPAWRYRLVPVEDSIRSARHKVAAAVRPQLDRFQR